MVGAIASGADQVAGALLAMVNPRAAAMAAIRRSDPAGRPTATAAVERSDAVESPEGPTGKHELTEEERAEVREMARRDREVRQHEQAHKSAAGQFAKGSAQFEYETGPDGKRYAVGGEVSIDTSAVPDDPQATIQKMQAIQRAASAPAEPSAQDRQIAAQSAQTQRQAKAELAKQRRADQSDQTQGQTAQADTAPSKPADPSGHAAETNTASSRPAGPPDRAIEPGQPTEASKPAGTASGRPQPAASAALAQAINGFANLDTPGRFIDVRV
ncbi:MAG: hypothetical protein IID40_04955 [Planctomycetes bacterium]|nr:hypothetical protein [Planctomycetota bacterium]